MGVHYEFGGFRLDPHRRSLADGNGERVPLAPRAFDALLVLVRRPGRLIAKAELMKAIWPKAVVADNSLDQIMSRLRRALAEHGASQSFIDTERGRGYRFSTDVRTAHLPDPARPAAGAGSGSETTGQVQAMRLHAQAVTLSLRPTSDNLAGAFELLQTALTLDPSCAPALAYRALLRTVCLAFDVPIESSLAAAERDARRALDMDPNIAKGHHALASGSAARGAWNEAAEHYETACALEAEPHARISRIYQLLHAVGHLHRALADAESIDRLSSSQPLGTVAAAVSSMLLGRNSDALHHADRACALGWPRTHPALLDIYFQLALRCSRFQEAADSMGSALSKAMRAAGGAEVVDRLCAALAFTASRAAAVAELRALIARMRPQDLGVVDRRRLLLWLTMLGALDDAFVFADASLTHLARTETMGLICARGILWMPEMEPFRRDARFQSVVTRLRFADYWGRHGAAEVAELRCNVPVCSELPPK